jgi:hypothetical protein
LFGVSGEMKQSEVIDGEGKVDDDQEGGISEG